MSQNLSTAIQELDTVTLAHDLPEHQLKQGAIGAVVHCYSDSKAFEVEFVDSEGYTIALLTLARTDIEKPATVDRSPAFAQPMSETSKVQMNFNAPVYGAAGNVEGDQIINASEQTFEVLLTDFKQFVNHLQQDYPNATSEMAHQVIDVEAKKIERDYPFRWQNFLSLKRLWNGAKKGSLKADEHFAEQTPWGKAAIGFLEGVTDDLK